jgi:hypothetical protein
MATGAQSWQIVAGVRRARAFHLAGYSTIPAQELYPDGKQGPVFQVKLDCLLSPKVAIDMSTNAPADRFWSIWNLARSGKGHVLQPIVVRRGSHGTRLEEVGWEL